MPPDRTLGCMVVEFENDRFHNFHLGGRGSGNARCAELLGCFAASAALQTRCQNKPFLQAAFFKSLNYVGNFFCHRFEALRLKLLDLLSFQRLLHNIKS